MPLDLTRDKTSCPPAAGPLTLAARWIWQSLTPRTEAEAAIVADQLRLTRGTSNVTDAALPLAGGLIALACRNWASPSLLIGWVAGIAIICLAINLTGRKLDKMLSRGVAGTRCAARLRTAMTAGLLAAWVAMGLLFWVPGNIVNHMFLVLVLACSLATSASILAAHPASVASTIVLHGGVLLARPLIAGDPMDLTLAGLCLTLIVLMGAQVGVIFSMAERARALELERHRIVDDLRRAKLNSERDRATATEAGRAKTVFLANMSHELRTPMNAILGFSEVIKSKALGASIDKYTQYAEIIHESGQHLLDLISDMLDLARIEGGRLTLEETTFSLNALMREIVGQHQDKAQQSQIALETVLPPSLPRLEADRRAIGNIVANLLSNALKFTAPGGRITVSTGRTPEGGLVFAVEDTGIGIAPEDQLHVFERFGRARHDITVADQGTGLGLAIVKGFAEAHDGEVALESAPGVGTRVSVRLPPERSCERPLSSRSAG